MKLGWDDPVPQILDVKWRSWCKGLDEFPNLHFDRCVVPTELEDGAMELHHFCDGSQLAYGTCTYIRLLNKAGKVHVQLLMVKCRLTPLRSITLPRIEFSAAVLAVNVDEVLSNELELELLPSTFWSDSQVVLSYIRSEAHRFKVFVANRVSYIRSLTVPEQCRYVPSGVNPADVVSRGCTPNTVPDQ